MEESPNHRRKRPLGRGQEGQMLLMFLIFLLSLTMVTLSVFNLGIAASEKIKVQNAADNAAYSAATWEARYMNLTAYINRAMVANYDTIATLVAVWSMLDAIDGFLIFARDVLDVFFGLGEVLEAPHAVIHLLDEGASQVVGGNTSSQNGIRVAYLIEEYSDQVLNRAQQLLYIMAQLGRSSLIQNIAAGTDHNITYWLPAEAWNAKSLDDRRVYQSSEKTLSSNPDDGLRLTIEHSLNDFSGGEALRETNNLIPKPIRDIIDAIPIISVDIGWQGYDGPWFDHKSGQDPREDFGRHPLEPEDAQKDHIVNDDQLYQLDHAGIIVGIDLFFFSFDIRLGHSSDDQMNLPFSPSIDVPHLIDDEGPHDSQFIRPNTGCSSGSGTLGDTKPPGTKEQIDKLSGLAQQCENHEPSRTFTTNGGEFLNTGSPGTLDLKSCSAIQLQALGAADNDPIKQQAQQCQSNTNTADFPSTPFNPTQYVNDAPGSTNFQTCEQVENDLKDATEVGKPDTSNLNPGNCATVYNWEHKLKTVDVTTYVHEADVKDGLRVEGPTIFVFMGEEMGKMPHLFGMHLWPQDATRRIEAYSFAKVYYTQHVGDKTGVKEDGKLFNDSENSNKETMFNPFWAPRLERPDHSTVPGFPSIIPSFMHLH